MVLLGNFLFARLCCKIILSFRNSRFFGWVTVLSDKIARQSCQSNVTNIIAVTIAYRNHFPYMGKMVFHRYASCMECNLSALNHLSERIPFCIFENPLELSSIPELTLLIFMLDRLKNAITLFDF